MEKAAKGVTTPEIVTEEIVATTEEIAAEVKEEVIETPSRLRQALHRLAASWERVSVQSSVSRSDVVGSGLGGMYGAKFQALAKEHEQGHPDKG
jgi:predicted esterase YcpF (UPF0227 family)